MNTLTLYDDDAAIFSVRTSDFVLDKVFNPLKDKDIGKYTPDQLNEWCGIIPDFFSKSVLDNVVEINEVEKPNKSTDLKKDYLQNSILSKVADKMDEAYGYPAFGNSVMTNKPSDFGIIFGTDGEPDLKPIGKFSFHFLELLVYDYGMAALRIIGKPNAVKFGRFD